MIFSFAPTDTKQPEIIRALVMPPFDKIFTAGNRPEKGLMILFSAKDFGEIVSPFEKLFSSCFNETTTGFV